MLRLDRVAVDFLNTKHGGTMTFEDARKLAKEYEFLRGQMNRSLDSTIVAITILAKGDDCQVKAFYYTNVSGVGHDPIEWYEDRKQFKPFSIIVNYNGKEVKAQIQPINPGKLPNGYPDEFLFNINNVYFRSVVMTAGGWKGNLVDPSLAEEIGEKIMLHFA